jgi:hypothetical protein
VLLCLGAESGVIPVPRPFFPFLQRHVQDGHHFASEAIERAAYAISSALVLSPDFV